MTARRMADALQRSLCVGCPKLDEHVRRADVSLDVSDRRRRAQYNQVARASVARDNVVQLQVRCLCRRR